MDNPYKEVDELDIIVPGDIITLKPKRLFGFRDIKKVLAAKYLESS